MARIGTLSSYRAFTAHDADAFNHKAARGAAELDMAQPDHAAFLAARGYLLRHGFASDPDGRWRSRTHVATLEHRATLAHGEGTELVGAWIVVAKLHAEEADFD